MQYCDHQTNFVYRADIDGLRAVAVLAVIFYHADFPGFGGGFVGVDIFFVISGYLIASLILGEIAIGKFSLQNFYVRRCRRIIPALFLILVVCCAAGWLILTPQDYVLLGRSVFATSLFASNLFFWRQSGYFDAPEEKLPLLHTWSLGVEEQFYIVFPLLLMLISRLSARKQLAIILALGIFSFTTNVLAVKSHPSAAFYLPPSRIWELFVGVILAMGCWPKLSETWSQIAGVLGAISIGFAIVEFSKETQFPGFAALLPTLGAAGIIAAGTDKPQVVPFLSGRVPVFIGKISYSLYLWHFPLLAFGNYVSPVSLAFAERLVLILLAGLLAIGSWLYVEQPIRRAKGVLRVGKLATVSTAAALMISCSAGFILQIAHGFPARMGKRTLDLLMDTQDVNPDREFCALNEPRDIERREPCRIGVGGTKPQFLLWGDSHAESLRAALQGAAARAGISGIFLGEFGCIPELGIERLDVPTCSSVNDAIVEYLQSASSIRTIILAGRWALWAEGTRYNREAGRRVYLSDATGALLKNHLAVRLGVERVVSVLLAAGKKIWFVGPIPEVGYDVSRALYLERTWMSRYADIRPTVGDFRNREHFVLGLLGALAKEYPVGIVWPHESLCDAVRCSVERNGKPLYFDDQHLTANAARSLSKIFDPIFVDSKE